MFFFCEETAFIIQLTWIYLAKFFWMTRLQKRNEMQENTFEIGVSNEISN